MIPVQAPSGRWFVDTGCGWGRPYDTYAEAEAVLSEGVTR